MVGEINNAVAETRNVGFRTARKRLEIINRRLNANTKFGSKSLKLRRLPRHGVYNVREEKMFLWYIYILMVVIV